ncbi:MAG TPA: acyl-CoA dehydrogenase family protein [Kofleriaceae bacterium]|nr:acyl-CoA dehydrogenase family protein [Kofleriaceae bacterium]
MKLSSDDLDVFFDERHQTLAAELQQAAGEIEKAAAWSGPGEARARAVARAMGKMGLYEWLLPRTPSVDLRALCLVREMLGYVSPLADAIFAVQGLGAHPLVASGAAPAEADALRRGDAIAAFALTEPEAGSDVGSLRATARRDGDGWVLEGDKTLISNAGLATHYLVFATVDPAAGKKGITAFWVPAATPGLAVVPIALGVEHPIGRIALRGCRVGAGAVVGEVGGGFALAMRTLDTFRVTVGAAAVGMARRAFDEARAHVTSRVQFGALLAETQLVQAHLADMACDLDAARLLVLRAALAADRGQVVTVPAAMAKLYATERAQSVIDTAVQLLGGRGVCQGEVVEALYRAVRPLRIYEGTSEIQRIVIGRAIARGNA